MASKYYYIFVVLGLLLIIVSAFVDAYLLFVVDDIFWASSVFALILIEIIIFINRVNKINRRIAVFFNSINNHDTSVILPKFNSTGFFSDIYNGMSRAVDVFQDVKMESEFKEKLFMAMIEHSTTGFISIDQHGDFEIMNQMARNLLKVEHTSNIERIKIINPELHRTLINLKPGKSKLCKINSGEISTTLQVSMSALNYKDKHLKLVSLLDIQKELEAGELESWQKLIRIMNHEIMNSIAPITSTAKTLSKIFTENDRAIKYNELTENKIQDTLSCIDVIDTMSTGLMHFVSNYRKMSKIPEISPKKIEIKKWSNSLEQILKECVQDHDLFEIQQTSKLEYIAVDESLLNQVLINLVKNASQAIQDDNEKRIIVKFEDDTNNSLRIRVWNSGKAIEEALKDKIFIPFFTTKEDGAGIGLYISRQIVNLHGGSLSLVSETGYGTEFTISL